MIIKEIPNFKLSQNINSIYSLMLQLFSSNRYEIKDEEESTLKIIIKLKDILGNDEMHEIILYKKELDVNTKMKLMEERIKKLENKVEEMNEIKEKINLLISQKLKDEINKLKLSKNNLFIIPEEDSKIIQNEDEIIFVKKEIEKKFGKINKMKLLYRATRDGDSNDKFHSICDNIPNTLMIVKTTTGYKFGGFTSTGWKCDKGKAIYDKNAFCFSINLNKIYNIINPIFAMYNQSDDGSPSFGFSPYVFLLRNRF